jgi:hypothetical protein
MTTIHSVGIVIFWLTVSVLRAYAMVGHREEILFGEIFSEKFDNAKGGKTVEYQAESASLIRHTGETFR